MTLGKRSRTPRLSETRRQEASSGGDGNAPQEAIRNSSLARRTKRTPDFPVTWAAARRFPSMLQLTPEREGLLSAFFFTASLYFDRDRPTSRIPGWLRDIPPPSTAYRPARPHPQQVNGLMTSLRAHEIVVPLGAARLLQRQRLIGESKVSTGKAGFSTPHGHHRVVWKTSTLFDPDWDYVTTSQRGDRTSIRASSAAPPDSFDGAACLSHVFTGRLRMHQGSGRTQLRRVHRLPQGMAGELLQRRPLRPPVIVKQNLLSDLPFRSWLLTGAPCHVQPSIAPAHVVRLS